MRTVRETEREMEQAIEEVVIKAAGRHIDFRAVRKEELVNVRRSESTTAAGKWRRPRGHRR